MNPREKLLKILLSLRNRIASPSDIIAGTGLPRYEVLAAFHILDALGLVELVYVRGNYRLYRLTNEGKKIVDVLNNGKKFVLEIKPIDNIDNDINTEEARINNVSNNVEAVTEV